MKNLNGKFLWIAFHTVNMFLLYACGATHNSMIASARYKGGSVPHYKRANFDGSRKMVFIVADNDGTEMFDMLAPFYLFSATEKANVLIVSEHKSPIFVNKGLFVIPHFTFCEIDSLHITADVLVIPNQSIMVGGKQKRATVEFIKNHYTGSNMILAVCDGSATAAATGLYDGKNMTTHSSDYAAVKKQFNKPAWVQNVTVTQSGNLFSTAGISNATEGSLAVINELFGRETMQKVMTDIYYPHSEIKKEHQNATVHNNSTFIKLNKGTIKRNGKVGVLLQSGINEFNLAAILDTYRRSFTESLETFSFLSTPVVSKYGLILLPTGDVPTNKCTELHILSPESLPKSVDEAFRNVKFIKYDQQQKNTFSTFAL